MGTFRAPPESAPKPGPRGAKCYNASSQMDHLKALIREVPDFPKPGILFYDITTLLKDKDGLRAVVDGLSGIYEKSGADVVVGIEARGFIFAPAVAYALGAGFVPVRKPKKLPAPVQRIEYALEYGTDVLEIHKDAIQPGQKVLVIDDVLATGGTLAASTRLIERAGWQVTGVSVVLELTGLNGRDALQGRDIRSLLAI